MTRTSSLCERPGRHRPRRLADWLNPTGERKVHSLVDKIYQRKNLQVAWEKVKQNRGAGGIDGEDLEAFEAELEANLERLHQELKDGAYVPQPVLQHLIPKAGKPGQYRPLGIPTIYDRVCQQAMLNRLQPIFDPVFDEANFGYRAGRSTKDALSKIWQELEQGNEWVVDADLKDFFWVGGSRQACNPGQSARVRRSGPAADHTDPGGRLRGGREAAADGGGRTPRWGDLAVDE